MPHYLITRASPLSVSHLFLKTVVALTSLSFILPMTSVQASAPTAGISTHLNAGLDHQAMDLSVRPQDDFYQYVNGTWLKNVEIPSDKSRWGSFDQLHENSIAQLRGIVEALSRNPKHVDDDSEAKKIATLYADFMDEEAIDKSGSKPVKKYLHEIDGLKNKPKIATLTADFERLGLSSPLALYVSQDMKQSTKMIAGIYQSGLGLPDRDYYLKDDTRFQKIRAAYKIYVADVLKLAGEQDVQAQAKAIIELETGLAKVQWTQVQNRDVEKTYNEYALNDLSKLAPHFDWAAYFKQTGLQGKIQTIQINQPSFVKGFSDLLQSTPLSTWKSYYKWQVINGFAPYLSRDFVERRFAFYGKTLREIPEQDPRWKRGVYLVEGALGEALGKRYVAQYFKPEQKQRMDQLVQNLLKAYDQRISELDWMSPATKVEARKKLNNMAVKIGYPVKWKDYTSLKIVPNDLVGNLTRAAEFRYNQGLAKLGKPVDRDEWGMTPQTVNAYYNPSLNEIVFPAGILQPPFFNIAAEDAVNYGGIGAVIGHEISHAFDDQGSQFDEKGNLKNWWTEQDKQHFKNKTQALVEQYGHYEPLKGYHVNGELTLGENIADVSGLSIAYKAYELSLNGQPSPVIEGWTGEQRLYMGWVQVWRGKVRDGQAIEYIKTDPHSPPKVRGNGALLNQTPFYKAFGIEAGDKMYLPKSERVQIW